MPGYLTEIVRIGISRLNAKRQLIDDLREELSSRPYELLSVAGGWQHRTRPRFADTIRASSAPTRGGAAALSEFETMVLMAVGYFQPITRVDLSKIFGKEVSRDTIGNLRGAGFIGSGPRSPTPGAPYTYVTTQHGDFARLAKY